MGIEEIQSGSSLEPTSTSLSGSNYLANGATDVFAFAAQEKPFLKTQTIDDFKSKRIRDKLKTVKKGDDEKKRGPLIVKHPSTSQLNVEVATNGGSVGATAKEASPTGGSTYRNRGSRTPSPSAFKSDSFLDCKKSLQRSHSIVSPQRRRSPSTPRSRPSSPSSFKGPSPAGSIDNLYIETVRKRVTKAQKARLYLLQQPGPHSFVIGGDLPENKFKTIIGPQSCTCGHGPHCIHLLFVMLRVFQINENNHLLWSRQLKNFEVESLFARYEKQRQSRISIVHEKIKCNKVETNHEAETNALENLASKSTPEKFVDTHQDEGELCSICLLDMVDGESLVSCLSGCRNKLHHHCISIWAEECRRQKEPFLCPLCRTPWVTTTERTQLKNDVPLNGNQCCSNITNHSGREASQSSTSASSQHHSTLSGDSAPSLVPTSRSASFSSTSRSIPQFVISPSKSFTQSSSIDSQVGPKSRTLCHGLPCEQIKCYCSDQLPHPQISSLGTSGISFVRTSGFLKSGSHVHLPRCHSVIPKEHNKKAATWGDVFGSDLVGCLYSRDWRMRETALRWLNQEMVEAMSNQNGLHRISTSMHCYLRSEDTIQCCCQILALVAADPVYRVYLACLQCLRTVLAYVPIKTEAHLFTLQDLIQPVVNTILLRCCDATKRASQLSISTLVELCKGQNGDLAVGHHTSYPADVGIGGVNYILKCIFENMGGKESHSWQWILGRLNVLQQLMEKFPQEFHLVLIPSNAKETFNSVDFSVSPIASRQERLMTLLNFALNALRVNHATVGKQAREVFMVAAHFAATLPATLRQVCNLATVDPLIESRFNSWIRGGLKKCLVGEPNTPSTPPLIKIGSSWSSLGSQFSLPHSTCLHNSSQHNHTLKKMVAIHPHLPSCGGISPTKGLDRNYFEEKMFQAGGASKRRFSGRNHSTKASPTTPWMPSFSIRREPHLKSTKTFDAHVSQKRPNFLPLHGTFKDVLEWERFAGKSSVTPNPLPQLTRYRSPTRFDRKPKAAWDSSMHVSTTPNSPTSAGRALPQIRASSQSLSKKGVSNIMFPPKSPRTCTCNRDVATPVLHRKPPEPRQNFRLCSKKLDAILGPILPTMMDTAGLSNMKRDSLTTVPLAPPPTPDKTDFSVNNAVSKSKRDMELEEAVALVKAMEYSSHQNELITIPGLMQYNEDQELIIQIEPDDLDEDLNKIQSSSYVETIHWQKGSLLGTGAFSTCYQARDLQTGTLMALKQVSICRNSTKEQVKVIEDIKEEIALMAQLDHPNIVRILGATQQSNHFNMFVEWMPGGSIANLLDKFGPFMEPVIINYTKQVLAGLAYLHDHYILHRDLKGANLLIDSTGHHLRIGDFGAAARLAAQETMTGEFQGQLLGTIAFMAPEVLRGESYGRSCDIWSVGCAIIEMATTKPPWSSNHFSNHLALIYKIAQSLESPPIPEYLSPATRDLTLRCLELNSEDRPPAKDLLKHPIFHMEFC